MNGLPPPPMPFAAGVAPSFPAPPPMPTPQHFPPVPPPIHFNIPPPPPPPSWRGKLPRVERRFEGPELDLRADVCNAYQISDGQLCGKAASCNLKPKEFMPVCRNHKKRAPRIATCEATVKCKNKIRWQPHFYNLCDQHKDEVTHMRCHLLRLPVEIRMNIFTYLLPDQPISAWLDDPLRSDGVKCTTSLLLVSKQISQEASDVLYGAHPFTVSIQRNSLNLCGWSYYHNRSDSQITLHPSPTTQYIRPPMLSKIRSIRIQMSLIKPTVRGNRRSRVRSPWVEEVEVYDLRDSVLTTVQMLQQQHSPLRSLSILLTTQNQAGIWEEEEQISFLELITEPFKQLRNIPVVKLENIYYCRDQLRMNVTQYILDKLSPAVDVVATMAQTTNSKSIENAGPVWSLTDFWLSNSYHCSSSAPHPPPLLSMSRILTTNDKFAAWKKDLEEIIMSRTPAEASPRCESARRAFAAFRQVYTSVDSYYFTRLPKGGDWLLHQARVAREKGDLKAIHACGVKLEKLEKGFVEDDKAAFERKKSTLERAVKGFYNGEWGGEGRIGGGWQEFGKEEKLVSEGVNVEETIPS
ncbi:hypothetical protein BLS_003947 [Venturia inaequalis]|uniref:F-box domain-containing protein n=1 Tax=Venturia inaequalis TaxID=5025 RepID=A0A8H3YWX4_VENIN|nr:hypothetical protein EG327_009613 [Venturia inaequalis]KAE9972607.1 hypothetical protein BLS_003947 [Venturia inaequalis]RDI82917.1 hypothetical protein Vi05172_g7274 [Venturia inaequalis]